MDMRTSRLMQSVLVDESSWAAGLAARLRLLQASCADVPPAERQQFVAEEIERSLKGIAVGKKKSYLTALAEKFPTWGPVGAPAPVVAVAPASEDDTPQSRLARLLEIIPQLSPEEKAEFTAKLRDAGIVATEQAATLEIPNELRTRLAISADKPVQGEQVVKLLAALTEWSLVLDQLSWRIWKQLAPNSVVRRDNTPGGDFKTTAGRYLAGDRDVSIEQLAQNLAKSRKLIAALLTAIGPAAERYAAKYFYRFSPEAIKELAQMDKTWGGIEQKCWRKYAELAASFPTPASIEKEIRDDIVVCGEELMLGPAASAGG
jgi:hypothetical protein